MTRREQAIEIAAKAHAEYDILRWRIEAEDSDEELPSGGVFGAIADALLAAGVIPAEGMVVVDRGRWERVVSAAEAAQEWGNAPIGNSDALRPGDLDAIPDAPAGEILQATTRPGS